MPRVTPRLLWSALAGGCLTAVAASLVLQAWLALQPCHLCIFQRLLFLVLGVLAGLAALFGTRRGALVPGLLALPCAVAGLGTAGYQSWLQRQPVNSISCVTGEPGPIESLVEWLGQHQPDLFLATGFCEDIQFQALGLSLADWALLGFMAALILALWAFWPRTPAP